MIYTFDYLQCDKFFLGVEKLTVRLEVFMEVEIQVEV
jgi:hypothetical protein